MLALLVGAVFFLLGLCVDLLYAASSGAVGRLLSRSPAFVVRQRYLTGSVYLALGVAAAFGGGLRRG